MLQFSEFVMNHWLLFLALLIILTLFVMSSVKNKLLGYKELKPNEVVDHMNHHDAIILDVREDKEYLEGHVLNAIHIPLGDLNGSIEKLEDYKARPLVVYCRAGQRSARAATILQQNGFEQVSKMSGGMLSWRSDNLPVSME